MEIGVIIENSLSKNKRFALSQTFGHPFTDFTISHVGETFEKLIDLNSKEILPDLEKLYKSFMTDFSSQFISQNVNKDEIFGRVARMWASLVREWHAYFAIKEEFKKRKIQAEIIRNDLFDTFKGIDIYIKNKNNPEKSIKVDILQETKKALDFRKKKDNIRIKGEDIPGKTYRVFLGKGHPNETKYLKDVNGMEWFLLSDNEVEKIVGEYIKN